MDKQKGVVVIAGALWLCAAAITALGAVVMHETKSTVDVASTAQGPLADSTNAGTTAMDETRAPTH